MASPILPDDLWKRLEPLIPKPKENRHVQFAGRKPTEPRQILAGILFVLRTGIPWRWLPATNDFPCGQTCRRHLQQWHKAGVWQEIFERLLAELQATHKIDWYRALVDSASVFAPPQGARTEALSTSARYQSILWVAWSSASRRSKISCQTPALCHCWRWRRQVCPQGKSLVAGSQRQGMPVRRTKRIPARIWRGSVGFRPANCTCRFSFGFGIKGSRRFQRSSGKMGLAIRKTSCCGLPQTPADAMPKE